MQKYYTKDYLTKKVVKNQSELEQYFVDDHHPAIVSNEVFEIAQILLNEKNNKRNIGMRAFSSIVVCGDCGAFYGSKVWHSNDKYRKVVYVCNYKYKDKKCTTPKIDETRLEEIFVEAINRLLVDKDEIPENLQNLIAVKKESIKSPEQISQAAVDLETAKKEYSELIEQQKTSPASLIEFDLLLKAASEKYDEASSGYKEMLKSNDKNNEIIYELKMFVDNLKNSPRVIKKFDYELMRQTVRQMTVLEDGTVTVEFFSGETISLEI